MALSNAERQRRWVQRLKERAAAGTGPRPGPVTNSVTNRAVSNATDITYPEAPADPDDPEGPKERWTDAEEPNAPALVGVIRALGQYLGTDSEFADVRAEPGHNKHRHWDRLSFEVTDS